MVVDTEVHPSCLAAYEEAKSRLGNSGTMSSRSSRRSLRPSARVRGRVAHWGRSDPLLAEQEDVITPLTRHLRERGGKLSAVDLAEAVARMRGAAVAAITATAEYDVLLHPDVGDPSPRVGQLRDDEDPAADFEAQKRFTPFTAPFNVSGQPAMSIRCITPLTVCPWVCSWWGVRATRSPSSRWRLKAERVVGWHTRVPPLRAHRG